jgi:hypothetical protein
MRLILASLIYLYSLIGIASAETLVVQSHVITDLYGTTFAEELSSQVVMLDRRARPKDVTHILNQYAQTEKYKEVTVLGQLYPIESSKRFSIVSQFTLNKVIKDKVYVLQGAGELETERLAAIKEQTTVTEVFEMKTEHDLRLALIKLKRKDKGFLIINVFNLRDNWNAKLSYPAIEEIVVEANRTHVDVGICYKDFRTALAIGPTPDDAIIVLTGGKSTSICASLERLKKLGSMDIYDQLSGTFYRVITNKRE